MRSRGEMIAPDLPALTQLDRITPSIYDASISCLAKAAWYAFGGHSVLPEHPGAILGTSFHAVVASAHRGSLAVANSTDRTPARRLFDEIALSRLMKAHPLVNLKFAAPQRLPYYNLYRERCAWLATQISSSRLANPRLTAGASTEPSTPVPQTESRLFSVDGLIVGRPDYLNGKLETVVDYKSGYVAEGQADVVSEPETRQLRLYAYLAIQNGIRVTKGTVVRGNGSRCDLPISLADAEAEANKAREQLQLLNRAISGGKGFNELASPGPRNCRACPCIPFCDSFWTAAQPGWHSECGGHVEGHVAEAQTSQIQGISLTSLLISVQSGTVSSSRMCVEHVPSEWMRLEGISLPQPGERIRAVHGRLSDVDKSVAVLRVDKAMTAVWRFPFGDEG
jgi:hypothetical protein